MNLMNSNMIVRAMRIFGTATCGRNKDISTILQSNVNFQIISRSKNTGNPFIPTQKPYTRKIVKKKDLNLRPYLLLGVPIITFGLGTWQVFRLQQKREFIDMIDTQTSRKPMELPENLEELKSKDYYPVKVRGRFLHDKEFLVGPRAFLTNESKGLISFDIRDQGYVVITPFEVEDRNLTILINRGWVPRLAKDPSKRQDGQVEGTVELVGLVRQGEKKSIFSPNNKPEKGLWIYKDIKTMAQIAGTEPVYLEAVASSTINGGPIGGQTRINVRNDHMSYILTWYGVSAGSLYVWFKTFRTSRL